MKINKTFLKIFLFFLLQSTVIINCRKRSLAPQHIQELAWKMYNTLPPKTDQKKKFLNEKMLYVYETPNTGSSAAFTDGTGIYFPSNSFSNNKQITDKQFFSLSHEIGHNYNEDTYNRRRIYKAQKEMSKTGKEYCSHCEIEAQIIGTNICYALKNYNAIEKELLSRKFTSKKCPYRRGIIKAFNGLIKKHPQDKKLQKIKNHYFSVPIFKNKKTTTKTIKRKQKYFLNKLKTKAIGLLLCSCLYAIYKTL